MSDARLENEKWIKIKEQLEGLSKKISNVLDEIDPAELKNGANLGWIVLESERTALLDTQ